MSYSVKYEGQLCFKECLSPEAVLYLADEVFRQDIREHPEWNDKEKRYHFYFIDLELFSTPFTDSKHRLIWNGSEKTSCLEEQIDLVLDLLDKKGFEFELNGTLLYQGEELGDFGQIKVVHNVVTANQIMDCVVTCPACQENFKIKQSKPVI